MDPAELLDLTRALRAQLKRHVAAGSWAAPGGATARSASDASDAAGASIDDASDAAGASIDDASASVPEAIESADDEIAVVTTGRRSLARVRADLGECTRCKLHTTRKSIVFGVGDPGAPLMFVGEAPGEQEDKRGEPFVGPAGALLDKMIEAMGWSRSTVYIANTLKCRPPGNRNPEPDELARCMPFLNAQVDAIGPRIIVAMGRPAANQLLERDAPISALRGKFHDRRGVSVMPTFHPAYLLREPDRKRDAWADLKQVMAELARLGVTPPGVPRG